MSGTVTRRRLILAYAAVAVGPAILTVLALIATSRGGTHDAVGALATSSPGTFDVSRVLLTIVIVVVAAHGGGAVARLAHQPRIIGQALVGLLLGPSILGRALPDPYRWLHNSDSSHAIDVLAQLGVILFVFLIARELGATTRHTGGRAVVIGHAMIVLPFLCGVLMAILLIGGYRPATVGPLPYALFIGLATGATALPVLGHILAERGLLASPIGSLAVTSAAIGDATLWCLLGITMCMVHRGPMAETLLRAAAALAVGAAVWWGLRPLLRPTTRARDHAGPVGPVLLLAGLLLCAQLTDLLGLHAIFGAFLFGLVVPREYVAAQRLTVVAEGMTEWLLLPLFFTAVGSRTRLDLISGPRTGAMCLTMLAIAVASKLVATGLAGRAVGVSWRDSAALGVMMNCRGLTELLILNVGLTAGIINVQVFACFVVMALVTTALTGPLLTALNVTAPGQAAARQDVLVAPDTAA